MKFWIRSRTAAAGAALLTAMTAAPEVSAETLADALAKAYENNPTLSSRRAGLRAAGEAVRIQRAPGLGTVSGDYSYGVQNYDGVSRARGGNGNTRDTADEVSLGITGAIPLYDGGQIANSVRAAQENVNSVSASLESVEQTVLLDAVTAYEDVRRDIQRVALARNNVRVISEQLRAARDRFEVGEVTRTDVSQAEARLAFSRSNLAAAAGALARSREAYIAAVGEPAGDLAPPPPLPPLPESREQAESLTLTFHPDLQAARFAVRQAEYDVKTSIGGKLPTLNLEGGVRYDNNPLTENSTTGETTSARVGISGQVPIWTGGRNDAQIRQAQALLGQRQAEVQDTARLLRQQTSIAWANLQVARASIVAARQQIEASQIAFEGVREEATLGARTTLDVLDAEQELVSAKVDLVDSLRDEYVAAYQLLASVGSLTVEHLGLKVERYDVNGYVTKVDDSPYTYERNESTKWSSRWKP